MLKTRKQFIAALVLIIAGFVIGIYLQDRQHQKSTKTAWEVNRANWDRFNRIRAHTFEMDTTNWESMRDSIRQEIDSFMVLRFRREMDSLNKMSE